MHRKYPIHKSKSAVKIDDIWGLGIGDWYQAIASVASDTPTGCTQYPTPVNARTVNAIASMYGNRDDRQF
jgi:hypothetical protein